MSQPKRYGRIVNDCDNYDIGEDKDGEYVFYSDYAALVQQGIRDHQDWRSKLNFLEADYKAEIARLTAENERLRKAGDAMADDLRSCQMDDGNKLLVDWEAAKKGRDAK